MNNDSLKTFRLNEKRLGSRLFPKKDEVYALLTLTNGARRRVELSYGSAYLSQSSRSILITPQVKVVEFYDNKGKLGRIIKL